MRSRQRMHIPGLALVESEKRLDELRSYAALPAIVWQQKLQPYDLTIWDNRRRLHALG